MSPWMIIVAIGMIGLGLLIIAPRLHRRSLERAGQRADTARLNRLRQLEDGAPVTAVVMADPLQAQSIQRRLLLRGVRAHMVEREGRTELVFDSRHADLVDEVWRAEEKP